MALDPATALRFALQEAVVGRYSIEREIGRGGMGIVYLVRDVRLDRPVALKLLPPDRAEVASIRERFLHEARMAARLSHPNIVPIHAVEEIDDFVFFAMQYVAGETLGDRLRRQQLLPPWDAARLLRDVAWALAYAHAQGVVHRDIKPDNILISQDGRALVADFGIAHHTDDAHAAGRIQGTPEYLSPEQAGGEPCDARSDLYSLGAVAFHALTGRPPFVGDTSSLLAQHLTAQPPRLVETAPELPARLSAAVDRALQKDPADRWPDAETMAEAFAPPLPMTADLPVPVRIWAERGREMKGFYVVWSLLFYGLSTLVFTAAMNAGQWPMVAKVALTFFLGAIPAPWIGHALWRLVETRRALESGASVEDLRHAVEVTRARREEEMRFDATRSVHWLPKLVRRVTYAGFFASLGVLIAGRLSGADFFASGWFAATAPPTPPAGGGGLFGVILPGRRLKPVDPWARLRARFWRSAPGRLFAKVAASGLPKGTAAWANWRPTEVALGGATETLHAALPAAQRDALADLPQVVARLEHEAVHARAQLDGGAEGPWVARLEAAVSAIETLRLGLLRIHADQAEVGSLTLDLEKARELSERIGYLADGAAEVDRVLKG
jgi:serine/threonine-protein kinase